MNSNQKEVLRAAGAMGAATFLSRILGLVREQVFAVMFGASNLTDAFQIAFRIPNLLRDLFAEGAMSASLVPTFTRVRKEQGAERAWRVAGLVFRVLVVAAGIIAVLGIFFAPMLVQLYASAFREVPGKFELTVLMTQVMFPFFPFVALAAAFMGILNACGVFFLPAFASALFNLVSIVVGVAGAFILPRFGVEPIVGMAIGVVVGGAVQAIIQYPHLKKSGFHWVPRSQHEPAWRRDPDLQIMLKMMVPGTIGLAATQVNVLVNSILATSQGPATVSWLNYAFRLMQFPIGIFGVSLAAATLPVVSRLWVDKDLKGIEATVTSTLRNVFAVNFPASAGLAFLGFPIMQLLFQYGQFTEASAHATAIALAGYAVGLTAYSAVKVLVPACYALGNTRVPVISSFFSVGATIVLNLIMIKPLGYLGLALGTSLSAGLNFIFLLIALRHLLKKAGGELDFKPIARAAFAHFIAALVMGLICWASERGLRILISDEIGLSLAGNLGLIGVRMLRVSLLVAEGGLLVLLFGKLFGLTETLKVFDIFYAKLKKKLSRK